VQKERGILDFSKKSLQGEGEKPGSMRPKKFRRRGPGCQKKKRVTRSLGIRRENKIRGSDKEGGHLG